MTAYYGERNSPFFYSARLKRNMTSGEAMTGSINSSLREIFCLVLMLSVTCLTSLFLHFNSSISLRTKLLPRGARGAASDLSTMVFWRPSSLTDKDISHVDTTIHETLIFVRTPFTGSEFFSQLIRNFLRTKPHLKFKIKDLRESSHSETASKENQTRQLQEIISDRSPVDTSSYITSDVYISDIPEMERLNELQMKNKKSFTVVRNPLHSLLASVYYHRHDEELFGSGNVTKNDFVVKVSTAIKDLETMAEDENFIRTCANRMSVTAPLCGWNTSKCFGVHRIRSPRVLSNAKKSASLKNSFIFIMEDAKSIPKLLEKISPIACDGLNRYFRKAQIPWWLSRNDIQLPESITVKLKKDSRIKLELLFYEWVKKKYYEQKRDLMTD